MFFIVELYFKPSHVEQNSYVWTPTRIYHNIFSVWDYLWFLMEEDRGSLLYTFLIIHFCVTRTHDQVNKEETSVLPFLYD